MRININSHKKLFYWGPTPGRPVFPDFWNLGIHLFSKKYKPGFAETLIYFEKERMTFVCDYQKLYDRGEIIFRKYILNNGRFKKVYRDWEEILDNFETISKKISGTNLEKLPNEELRSLFLEFSAFYSRKFWCIGLFPEISNWGGEQMLVREMKKRIGKDSDFILALERLSAPEDYSFLQQEEVDLLEIKLAKKNREKKELLIEHQKKYFWILNSYHHAKTLPVEYFRNNLKKISAREVKGRMKGIRDARKKAIRDKKDIIKKYKLPPNALTISRKLSFCIWWQDLRKTYIFRANHIINAFILEFSRRYEISATDLYFYTRRNLESLVAGKKQSNGEIRKRKKYFLIYYMPDKKETRLFSGKEARVAFRPFQKKHVKKNVKEFKGLVVNRGYAKGAVRIISNPSEGGKMKKGDILVATMTTPDMILALSKAGAIVTDEGGMTCHAAIVARELNIPAIVATRIATQILKSGDRVEIDANEGIVKIINKA